MKKIGSFVAIALFSLLLFMSTQAQTQNPLPFRLQQNFITGLSSPVLVTNAGDGTRRLFIVQQGGIIKVVQPGSNTPTDFLNITTKVLSGGERGLLGLAFHPEFATNGFFFVNYTRQTDGATIIARYKAINNNTVGDPASERIILGPINQPFSNHNGGGIAFRNDGSVTPQYNLYIGMGDGGSANDPGNRAQNINELLGKFLRITPDFSGSPTAPAYTIPPDNPYAGAIPGADEIYAIGMRNPWRWSFDRGGTRELWAGDVGQGQVEEVNKITLGGNYGWRVYEGTLCTNIDPGLCLPSSYIMPIFQYNNVSSPRCAVTGGYVYRGRQNALPQGSYLYGDYCTGEILLWYNNQQLLQVDTSRQIPSFGEDEDGELYVVGLGGTVDKILGNKTSADFDGDARADFGIFRPSNGYWYIFNSAGGSVRYQPFGMQGDIPVTEDYDGDFKADIAVFRPSEGAWYILRSSDGTVTIVPFGRNGDVPAAGDYTGDGKSDLVLFRPTPIGGIFYILASEDGAFSSVPFGADIDIPTPGDYDGDGRYDLAVWRPSDGFWYVRNPTGTGHTAIPFGMNGDIPATGDYDGDGKIDRAVFRPSTGVWYILRSGDGGVTFFQFGVNGDIPAVADYDGDGKDDIAVFRPSTGVWWVANSSGGLSAVQFGTNGDIPASAMDKP